VRDGRINLTPEDVTPWLAPSELNRRAALVEKVAQRVEPTKASVA
jgi:hypothetical protein